MSPDSIPEILLAGHPALSAPCKTVVWPDANLPAQVRSLHAALSDFQARRGFGRAMAAPQIGIGKRFIAVNLGAEPFALINPEITWRSAEEFEMWDDCLSVPDVIVRVRRHRSISVQFQDEAGCMHHWERLPLEMSELMQHEIDHLAGVLMTERAVAGESVRPIAKRSTLIDSARESHRLDLSEIGISSQSIDPLFRDSPQFECEALSEAIGSSLLLKLETANPIRCFKGRGADYFLAKASSARPMVCASAGNFGLAMAYACRTRGRSVTVFAAENANPMKVQGMRDLGAEVRMAGKDFDGAKESAREHARRIGGSMIEDGLAPDISIGAGSMAVELLQSAWQFEIALIPLGNGALIAGLGRWIKACKPWIKVIGVSARAADAMERSWRSGELVESESATTIADGVAVRVPIAEALEDMKGLVDDVVLVDEDAIRAGVALIQSKAGLLVEPSGALGVSAILADPERFGGQRIATILTGSNVV